MRLLVKTFNPMETLPSNELFFQSLDQLIENNGITLDRPKGTAHPRKPSLIYPINYGYINGTQSQDGADIDLFQGDDPMCSVVGIICTLDLKKNDSEVKVLYQCTEENIQTALQMLNHYPMRGILLRR